MASDLIRATRGVEPESPELSAKLLNMQKELFAGIDGSGHYFENEGYRLETYNKAARYFGDEKVADAYMSASEREVYKVKGLEKSFRPMMPLQRTIKRCIITAKWQRIIRNMLKTVLRRQSI